MVNANHHHALRIFWAMAINGTTLLLIIGGPDSYIRNDFQYGKVYQILSKLINLKSPRNVVVAFQIERASIPLEFVISDLEPHIIGNIYVCGRPKEYIEPGVTGPIINYFEENKIIMCSTSVAAYNMIKAKDQNLIPAYNAIQSENLNLLSDENEV